MTSIEVAISQLGVSERPEHDNKGAEVEKYLASVGLAGGYSWCMAFVYWCTIEAAKSQGTLPPLKKTGGVLAQWNSINAKFKFLKPRAGDIFIMDFGGGKGHTGFVESVVGDRIMTIEGNSNDDGSREGYEVCRKPNGRKISSCIGFIRTYI